MAHFRNTLSGPLQSQIGAKTAGLKTTFPKSKWAGKVQVPSGGCGRRGVAATAAAFPTGTAGAVALASLAVVGLLLVALAPALSQA